LVKLFVLVISLWGYTGDEWVYVGNQIILKEPMVKEECMKLRENWAWHQNNEFYRFSIECHEQ